MKKSNDYIFGSVKEKIIYYYNEISNTSLKKIMVLGMFFLLMAESAFVLNYPDLHFIPVNVYHAYFISLFYLFLLCVLIIVPGFFLFSYKYLNDKNVIKLSAKKKLNLKTKLNKTLYFFCFPYFLVWLAITSIYFFSFNYPLVIFALSFLVFEFSFLWYRRKVISSLLSSKRGVLKERKLFFYGFIFSSLEVAGVSAMANIMTLLFVSQLTDVLDFDDKSLINYFSILIGNYPGTSS